MKYVKFYRNLFYATLIVIFTGLSIMALFQSCSQSQKMVMPTNCKPPKKKEYHMIAPAQHNHEKKFMTSKKKKAK